MPSHYLPAYHGPGRHIFDAYVLPVLQIFNGISGPSSRHLSWYTDEEYAPVMFEIQCNDLFWWGTVDCEDLLPEDVPLLRQCVADLQALSVDGTYQEADILFCCRKRQMRPQQPYYKHIAATYHALFDACGPARDM